MAENKRRGPRLDQPREAGPRLPRPVMFREGAFGKASEAFARFMGTPRFLIGMTIFCAVWLSWNTLMPERLQFDPRALNYTLLTLILSLQASYAAPLLLLAQNRQDDRDRVTLEQDRARDERNLADTEYLTREVAALRVSLREVATRDYLRSELRDLLEELAELEERRGDAGPQGASPSAPRDKQPREKTKKKKSRRPADVAAETPTRAAAGGTGGGPAGATGPATGTAAGGAQGTEGTEGR